VPITIEIKAITNQSWLIKKADSLKKITCNLIKIVNIANLGRVVKTKVMKIFDWYTSGSHIWKGNKPNLNVKRESKKPKPSKNPQKTR